MKRSRFLLLALCLVSLMSVGATIAYYTHNDSVTNSMIMGDLEIETKESFDGISKTDVGVTIAKNSAKCYVRLFVGIPGIKNPNGLGTDMFDVVLAPNADELWEYCDADGYFYLNTIVENNNKDQDYILYKSIKPKESMNDEIIKKDIKVIVYAETLQVTDANKNAVSNEMDKAKEAFTKLKQVSN